MLEKIISLLEQILVEVKKPIQGVDAMPEPVCPTPPVVALAAAHAEAVHKATTQATDPGKQVKQITRDEVGTALIGLATDKGRDVAVAVLGQFGGAQKLDNIKAEDYPRMLDAIQKASKA